MLNALLSDVRKRSIDEDRSVSPVSDGEDIAVSRGDSGSVTQSALAMLYIPPFGDRSCGWRGIKEWHG